MTNSKLEKITRTAYYNVGFSSLIYSLGYFILFSCLRVSPQSTVSIALTPIIFAAMSLVSFMAAYNSKFRLPICFLLVIFLAMLNVNSCLKITLFFVIPSLLINYSLNKKHSIAVSIFAVIFIALSIVPRSTDNIVFIKTVLVEGYRAHNAAGASILMFITECILVAAVYIPYHLYVISLNNETEEYKVAKGEATDNVLRFCTTAMSYHSKYLLIHNRSVESITQLMLVDLAKKPAYKDYLTSQRCRDILFSVQFHDIGKIYIENNILDKPGKLTPEEYELIKLHPSKGYELFSTLPFNVLNTSFKEICSRIILEHHERLDGRGYPTGKTDISFEGQLIAVADVADALLSWRCYKKPFGWEAFVEILRSDKGLNQEFCEIVIANKDTILNIIDANNIQLKNLFQLSQDDIARN